MVVAVEGASNESRSTSELEGFAFGAAAVEAGSALDDAADALVVDAPEEDVDVVDFDLSLEWDLAEAAEEGGHLVHERVRVVPARENSPPQVGEKRRAVK